MTIPEQVRRQSEAIAKMYEEGNTDAAAPTTGEAAGVSEVQDTQADSAENNAPESASNEQRRSDTTGDAAELTFEQRYRTLQGMYNADTGRLRADNQQLNTRLSQLEQLLSTLSSQPMPMAATSAAERLVTDKDVEEYGDSIEVMRRVTKEEVSTANRRIAELEHMIRQMQTSVLPRVEQVAQRQAATAEQTFWSDLTAAVPHWRDTNADQKFHNWLLEVDPLTGLTRQTYLEDAQRSLDVRRVASIFSTWQVISGQSVAQPTRAAQASELDRQVSPGRGRSSGGASATSNNTKTYSSRDIAKFFDDVRKGTYRGREAERDRIERDIFAAQRENRIVANG